MVKGHPQIPNGEGSCPNSNVHGAGGISLPTYAIGAPNSLRKKKSFLAFSSNELELIRWVGRYAITDKRHTYEHPYAAVAGKVRCIT
jgi:hypothetical protein